MRKIRREAHLDTLVAFEVEQITAYACENELYGPYQEGTGEAVTRLVVTLEGERASLEELRRRRVVRAGRRSVGHATVSSLGHSRPCDGE
jgi:hypothetical protein